MGDIFAQEEKRLLAKARTEIEADSRRYETDPAYRSEVDARRAALLAEMEAARAVPQDEEDDEDQEEGGDDHPLGPTP
jgi:hypothetical protein